MPELADLGEAHTRASTIPRLYLDQAKGTRTEVALVCNNARALIRDIYADAANRSRHVKRLTLVLEVEPLDGLDATLRIDAYSEPLVREKSVE